MSRTPKELNIAASDAAALARLIIEEHVLRDGQRFCSAEVGDGAIDSLFRRLAYHLGYAKPERVEATAEREEAA